MAYEATLAEVIHYPGYEGTDIEAYSVRPLGPGPYPGVVIIHHGPAWDEWTREVANKLGMHGYAVIAPHLYYRFAPGASPDDAAAAARAAGGLVDAAVISEVDIAAKLLRAQTYSNGKVGIIGFCMGGRLTYLCACSLPHLDAAIDCWGGGVVQPPDQLSPARPTAPVDLTPQLNVPLMGLFGNEDTSPDVAEVNATEAALKQHNKDYEFHRYDGCGHAFICWDRPLRYRAEQSNDAWAKIFEFYGRHLGAPVAEAAAVR